MQYRVRLTAVSDLKKITADAWREVGHEGRWIEFYSVGGGGKITTVKVYRQEDVQEIEAEQG